MGKPKKSARDQIIIAPTVFACVYVWVCTVHGHMLIYMVMVLQVGAVACSNAAVQSEKDVDALVTLERVLVTVVRLDEFVIILWSYFRGL